MAKLKKSHRKIEPGLYAYPTPLGDEFKIKKIVVKGYTHWKVIADAGPWLGELELNEEFHSLGEAKIFLQDFCNENYTPRQGTLKGTNKKGN